MRRGKKDSRGVEVEVGESRRRDVMVGNGRI
jgi:hypothetical protein